MLINGPPRRLQSSQGSSVVLILKSLLQLKGVMNGPSKFCSVRKILAGAYLLVVACSVFSGGTSLKGTRCFINVRARKGKRYARKGH